ncbi:MAG: hypothetical protein RR877_10055 [Aurantimicrobium sp.]|uniref:hypothetical protein n=1 Tax=Aurantimicrobium sp. TaxID=1930784 RepID=UPI002FCC78FE
MDGVGPASNLFIATQHNTTDTADVQVGVLLDEVEHATALVVDGDSDCPHHLLVLGVTYGNHQPHVILAATEPDRTRSQALGKLMLIRRFDMTTRVDRLTLGSHDTPHQAGNHFTSRGKLGHDTSPV